MTARDPAAPYTGWARRDWVAVLARLTDGFARAVPRDGSPARAHLPGAAADDLVPSIEGFARMSVAWAAWLHEPTNPDGLEHRGRRHDVAALLVRGLADATDPAGPAFWGMIADRDQRIVEAAELSTALLLGGDRLRSVLADRDPGVLARILDWLALVDGRDIWPDNWVLFPMVNAMVRRANGRSIPDSIVDDAIDWMCARHVGDGWYSDGAGHALDLYTGWAIHWHLLWWATTEGARRPGRRATIVRRARAWLAGVAPMVAADGSFPRFGRSLGYRFALAAPFAQAALLGIDPLPPGQARRLASGLVRQALDVGAIDHATDWLRVGVGAERPAVVERYVSPGAAAWAAHAFVALAMPEDHPFWHAPESPLPADAGSPGRLAAARAGLLVSWDATTGETRLHNGRTGHPADIPGHDYAATYGKLTYRSAFPFDVPVDPRMSAGADDALVAIDAGADAGDPDPPDRPTWLAHRGETRDGSAGPGWILATYRLPTRPRATEVRTVLLALEDGVEVRLSAVRPGGGIRLREGGAVLGTDGSARIDTVADDQGVLIGLTDGTRTVAIRSLAGFDRVGCADASGARMNLIHERASHPYVEESTPSREPRLVATASVAVAAAIDPAGLLGAFALSHVTRDSAVVHAPGFVAAVAIGRVAPTEVVVAGWTVRGPSLRVVVVAVDGSSLGGERIVSIDGVLTLDRRGIVWVARRDGVVEATVEGGVRLDPRWSGEGLDRVSMRRGAGPFADPLQLDDPGVASPALVRRLARRAGTRLVTLRFERAT